MGGNASDLGLTGGLILALASAGLLNVSFFLQHRESRQLPALTLRHPLASSRMLLSSPTWLGAYLGGWVGWAMYIGALRLARLSLVQAISSAGLPLLALLAHRFGSGVSRHERVAAGIGGLALVLVCTSLGAHRESGRANLGVVIVLVAVGVAAAGLLAGPGRRLFRAGAALGTASGICYAVGDVATKGAVDGTGVVLVPIFLLASALGFISLQLAFQRGGLLQTAGLSTLVSVVVPMIAGIALYHERLPSGPAGWTRASGFVLSATAAVVLGVGRSERLAVVGVDAVERGS